MTIYLRPEINQLSDLLGLKLPENWVDSVQRYLPAMQNYLEYQISLNSGTLALITLGRDESFLDQIEQHLREIGTGDPALTIFQQLRRRVERATWGLKLALPPDNDIQVYVKKPLPLAQLLAALQLEGLTPAAAEQIQAIAHCLKKDHTHFFGADFTPGQPPPYQLYFTQYIQEDTPVLARLLQVIEILALPPDIGQHLSQVYPLLTHSEQTVWVSLGLVKGCLVPSLKLDFGSVPFTSVTRLLETLPFPPAAAQHLNGLAGAGLQNANYLGLRLSANALPAASLYITRIQRA